MYYLFILSVFLITIINGTFSLDFDSPLREFEHLLGTWNVYQGDFKYPFICNVTFEFQKYYSHDGSKADDMLAIYIDEIRYIIKANHIIMFYDEWIEDGKIVTVYLDKFFTNKSGKNIGRIKFYYNDKSIYQIEIPNLNLIVGSKNSSWIKMPKH